MDHLEELAKGESSEAQRLFRSADSALGGVASDLLEARRIMETIEGADDMRGRKKSPARS